MRWPSFAMIRKIPTRSPETGLPGWRKISRGGDAVSVDSLLVEWPGRGTTELTDVLANQFFDLTEGTTTDVPTETTTPSFGLSVFPNPFSERTLIEYSVESSGPVHVTVHNVDGRQVRTLVSDRSVLRGRHQILWDGSDDNGTRLPGGIYLYRVEQGSRTRTGSLTLMH